MPGKEQNDMQQRSFLVALRMPCTGQRKRPNPGCVSERAQAMVL
jgi:hypothetical protein